MDVLAFQQQCQDRAKKFLERDMEQLRNVLLNTFGNLNTQQREKLVSIVLVHHELVADTVTSAVETTLVEQMKLSKAAP